ncbi:diguanylate cyclase domain-containing protein, partial [Piscirickettsia salmonis]|uniref:diguanylate cyclase domain-containing protein n=1 Tax=Piscirickettsia salmonis TaxID=1238 RepID=UPI001E55FB4B
SLGPMCLGALFAGEYVTAIVFIQIPFYLVSMSIASQRLRRILVSTMLAERENERQARQDSLTGLLNRYGLLRALDLAVGRGSQGKAEFAVLYLDLDGFKSVNDTYGHGAGDTLLKQVSERLLALKPPGAEAGRIGGDEFVLLMRLDGHEDIRRVFRPDHRQRQAALRPAAGHAGLHRRQHRH